MRGKTFHVSPEPATMTTRALLDAAREAAAEGWWFWRDGTVRALMWVAVAVWTTLGA